MCSRCAFVSTTLHLISLARQPLAQALIAANEPLPIRDSLALLLFGQSCARRLTGALLRRVFLALKFDLGSASAALFLGNAVHHRGDMVATTPPSGLFCERTVVSLDDQVETR